MYFFGKGSPVGVGVFRTLRYDPGCLSGAMYDRGTIFSPGFSPEAENMVPTDE